MASCSCKTPCAETVAVEMPGGYVVFDSFQAIASVEQRAVDSLNFYEVLRLNIAMEFVLGCSGISSAPVSRTLTALPNTSRKAPNDVIWEKVIRPRLQTQTTGTPERPFCPCRTG